MPNFEGAVAALPREPKIVNTKYGPKPTFSAKMDDGQWYKFGFKDPKLTVGDVVSFTYNDSTYGPQVESTTISITPSAGSTPPPPATSGSSAPSSSFKRKEFPMDLKDPEISQVRRSAAHLAGNVYKPIIERFAESLKLTEVSDASLPLSFVKDIITLSKAFEGYMTGHESLVSTDMDFSVFDEEVKVLDENE